MSNDAWKEREKAAEDRFFADQNKHALERMRSKQPLKSPVSGEPMEQISLHGVIIDRCKQSGGIWLDAGELEQLMKHAERDEPEKKNILTEVFTHLFKKA